MTKIVMTMLVRDEIDIIAITLDFHLKRGIDHIVVIDNGSVDGTRDVLADYECRGLITLVDEPGRDFDQAEWMTKAAMIARDEHRADWILHSDADEFWLSPDGSELDTLRGVSADILSCQRLNMLCSREDLARGHWPTQCVYRVAAPLNAAVPDDPISDPLPCPYLYRCLPPKVITRADGLVEVEQGNHGARFSRDAVEASSAICIFHYPIRSLGQFRSKIENGGQSYENNERLPVTVGWHWRRWYRMLQREGMEAVLEDALPDQAKVDCDLLDGSLVEDRRMLRAFSNGTNV